MTAKKRGKKYAEGCSVDGCNNGMSAKGLCEKHYLAKWKLEHPKPKKPRISRLMDVTGQRFGKLLVLGRGERPGQTNWRCLCDCGAECIIYSAVLRDGRRDCCSACIPKVQKIDPNRMDIDGQAYKKCLTCNTWKPLLEFGKHNQTSYGINPRCKSCVNRIGSERRREEVLKNQRRFRAKPQYVEGEKWCPECRTSKPLGEFTIAKDKHAGVATYCRPCLKIRRDKSPKHPLHKVEGRNRTIKSAYGITLDTWNLLSDFQGGTCALCEATGDRDRFGVLHTDHSHDTGRVRGLLCGRCNRFLGVYEILISEGKMALIREYLENPPLDRLEKELKCQLSSILTLAA